MKYSIKQIGLLLVLPLFCYVSCSKDDDPVDPTPPETTFVWTENSESLPTGIAAMGFAEIPKGLIIFGGKTNTSTLAETYIYNESTGAIEQGPNLLTARSHPLCISMADGRVLIIGGLDASGNVLATCEIYDPVSNTIIASATMDSPRARHKGVLLDDERIFVSGGTSVLDLEDFLGTIEGTLETTEIYDPATDTWSNGPVMNAKRVTHSMAVLPNSTVLINGGLAPNGFAPTILNSCDIFDPESHTITQTTSMNVPRAEHTNITLQNGSILSAGGGTIEGMNIEAIKEAEIYNPSSNTWSSATDMSTSRAGYIGFLFPDGTVLFPSGDSGSLTSISPTTNCEFYNPSTDSWTAANEIDIAISGYAGYISADQKVVMIGGAISETELSNIVYIGQEQE